MELQWELMIFTLFICLGAGIFGVQGYLALKRKDTILQLPALISSMVSVGIGGIASFLHLQHWERIFNGFGHITSGITQEMIAIVVFMIMIVVYFIVLRKTPEDGAVPKWCALLAIVFSVLLVIVMAHSYNMASRPIWNSVLLLIYYLSNSLLFGGFFVLLLASIRKEVEVKALAIKISLVGVVAQAITTVAYAAYFVISESSYSSVGYYFDCAHPTNLLVDASSLLNNVVFGSQAALFWVGVVLVGLLIPALAAYLSKRKGSSADLTIYSVAGLVGALAGGMCFRVILYVLGFSVFMFY